VTVACAHCGLPAPGEGGPAFCCAGCEAVYAFLHDEGLDAFYARLDRRATPLRPVREIAELPPIGAREIAIESDATGRAQAVAAVEGITCAACVWLLERGVGRLPGVEAFAVNFANHRVRLRWDPARVGLAVIDARVRALGYALRPTRAATDRRGDAPWWGRIGVAAFCTMNLMWLSVGLYAGYFQGMEPAVKGALHYLNWGLATPVLFYSGSGFWRGAWRGLRARGLTMDLLICLATGLAYGYSIQVTLTGAGETYFDSVAMVIALLLAGRFLEHRARARASEATDRLGALLPATARVWRGGAWRPVSLAEVEPGDRLRVDPGERIPADGTARGATDVDESLLTGEARPAAKETNSRLTAGTLNLTRPVEMVVEAVGAATRLSAITRLLETAQASRPPAVRLADRLAGRFVAVVLAVASLTWLYWRGRGLPVGEALVPTVAVLIVACPCALALAIPVAIAAGTAAAARRGILFKGGAALEGLGRVRRLFLDKTGTLTRGRLRLVDQRIVGGFDGRSPVAAAAALAAASRHPIARAVAAAAPPWVTVAAVTGLREVAGQGIAGRLAGRDARLGRPAWAASANGGPDAWLGPVEWQESGDTVVAIAVGAHDRALLRLSDTLRPGSREALAALRATGVETTMLTGDTRAAAAALARELGLDRYAAELTPEEKLRWVEEARAAGPVAMVGDGINDGPALAAADVGIAVARGLDVAVEAADVLLLGDDLRALSDAFALARATRRTIVQNYAFAISYNLITVPAAAAGLMLPIFAAAAMAASSLTVTLNAMRLMRFDSPLPPGGGQGEGAWSSSRSGYTEKMVR
jgi:Cu2+-exporting ATPase